MSLPKNTRQGKSNREIDSIDNGRRPSGTHCAAITASGRSAVAVVAVRGDDAAQIVQRCFDAATKRRFSPNEIRFGAWNGPPESGAAAESVVVVPLTDDHFEIHCHGGPAATARVVEDLRECGASIAADHQWSRAENLLIREAEQVLRSCLTAKTAAIAMDQVRGALNDQIHELIDLTQQGRESLDEVRRRAQQILKHAAFTTRLAAPLAVVLVGPPNVGKSSLMNAMVGFDRSITYDAAGTTRDVLHADTVIDGLAVQLSDTAGIRQSNESIESQGIARARVAASRADLVIHITDPTCSSTKEAGDAILAQHAPQLRVLNKLDLLQENTVDGPWEVATNAITGEGVESLMSLIAEEFGRMVPPPESAVPLNDRQANLIGEVALAEEMDQMSQKLRQLLGD